MLELEQILGDFDGDVTDEDKERAIDAVLARIAENEEELADKVDSYIHVIAELDWLAEGRKAEADRLAQLAKREATNSGRLRDRLTAFLDRINRPKLKTKLHEISVADAGGKRALEVDIVEVIDGLPEAILTHVPEEVIPAHNILDMGKVREYLEAVECQTCAVCEQAEELHTDGVLGHEFTFALPPLEWARLRARKRVLKIK